MHRIKNRPDYLRVAATGRRWVTPSFILQYQPSGGAKGLAGPAVGFTVTKKVGNAVVRNRLRRRMKEAARLVLGDGGVMADTSGRFVMIGREAGVDAPFEKLTKDLKWALEKLAANADLNSSRPPKKAHNGHKGPASGQDPKKVHK